MQVTFEDILDHKDWYHRIPLGDGQYTPGRLRGPNHYDGLGLPADMSGKSFLDVGAFNGLHSFEAERRGAEDVLAVDVWRLPYKRQAFDMVRSYLDSDARAERLNAFDLSPERIGTFDVVLCSGVLYHNSNSYGIVSNLVDVAEDLVVIESSINAHVGEPVLEVDKVNSAHTSLREVPNLEAMALMLDAAGGTPTESFTIPRSLENVSQTAGAGVPPVEFGTLAAGSVIYQTRDREEPIDTDPDYEEIEDATLPFERVAETTAPTPVLITYETETAVRVADVQTRDFEGWVDPAAVSPREATETGSSAVPDIVSRGLTYFRGHGLRQTALQTIDYLTTERRSGRGVVHARIE